MFTSNVAVNTELTNIILCSIPQVHRYQFQWRKGHLRYLSRRLGFINNISNKQIKQTLRTICFLYFINFFGYLNKYKL